MRKDAYVRAYVGLGANLGRREDMLAAAIRALEEVRGIDVAGVSRLYATRPVGPPGQPEYLNAVAALDLRGYPSGHAGPIALLRVLKDLEGRFGRKPRERWGPRELDLDLLLYGRQGFSIDDPPLTVPHELAGRRLFVLAPLHDLAPALRPPGWHETVDAAYRRQLKVEGNDAAVPVGEWYPDAGAWRSALEG
jgi:2-amino-4-hydroxy-6-hydroxymethyldihydropteridine diphosphokinase